LLDGNDIQPFMDTIFSAPPIGACCFNDGSCTEVFENICELDGGLFNGVFSICEEGACPPSTPQIASASFSPLPANNCDGDMFNVGALSITGDGFHPEIQVEFTQAGQPGVQVFGVEQFGRQFVQVNNIPLGCFSAPGLWSIVMTNPDGQTATLPDAIPIDACPGPAFAIDSVAYDPPEVLTCPGEGPVNPVTTLTVDIFGTNLPPDLDSGSFESRVNVNLTAVSDGEHWYSLFPDQVTVVAPGHYQVDYPIFNGNVNFPVSNPPAGMYRITVSTCSQTLSSPEMVEIREECPP
jgi:hypothetical protein